MTYGSNKTVCGPNLLCWPPFCAFLIWDLDYAPSSVTQLLYIMLDLNSNTLATWCKEPTHLKRPWCWERLRAGGEGDDRGWNGWMASPTQWTWVWVNSESWRWTGRLGVLWSMRSQRVGHDWATKLNWTAFRTLLLTMMATPFLLRDSCPQ